MKKMLATMTAVTLMTAALAMPAMAEETSTQVTIRMEQQNGQQPPAMPGQNGNQQNGPQNGQQPPAMPGQNANQMNGQQHGQQPPAMPGQNGNQQNGPQNGQQPPAMPGQSSDQQNGQQPPELPSQSGDQQNGQQAPEMPTQNGNQQNGQMPSGMPGQIPGGGGMPGQNGQQPPTMPGQDGQMPGGMPGGMPGMDSGSVEYTAANTVTESTEGASYASTGDSENAVLVSEGEVTLSGAIVSKTGSASGDNADFYGVNAAVLATSGSTLTIADTTVTSDGAHANGIFSYGSGTTVNVSDTKIVTTGNNSGGLMTTGGATLNATNVSAATSGNSSAAIRSDRGGGTVNVSGGDFSTAGVGSPAIYSTADITVSDATLSATNSEAVVIEGGNSVTLENVQITGSNATLNGQSTQKTNVLIYQSMSGDASEGSSTFTMNGGAMTAVTGSMFHVTNVTTTITLEDVDFTYAEDSSVFLDASADSWGTSGKNGGNVTLNLRNQEITGAILSDEVSSVTLTMDSDSTWTLTGDSYLAAFEGDLSQVNLNGYTLYVNGEAVSK